MQDTMTPTQIRPFIFITALILFHVLQYIKPEFKNNSKSRIQSNWYLFITSIITLRLFIPAGVAGVILLTQKYGIFAFALHRLPFYADLIITIIVFDMLIYWQHRIFHIIDPLWKLHKVHHCDNEMDVSTGFRFHPFEIVLSAGYKIGFLMLLSPRVETFVIYEIMLNTMAMFNHSNLALSKKLDQILRKLIVTPAMHYPHHDVSNRLMNLNYGNTLSVWDRIFGTYTNEDIKEFGTSDVAPEESSNFVAMLKLPFKK